MPSRPQLNPTLWRTCRVLSGRIRLQLLRQLHDAPGQCVSALAERVGIGISDASQELRRIQSRGLLRPEHQGVRLVYRLKSDPQVASAAPLLQALHSAFLHYPPEQDAAMAPIATGLAHERRIALVRELLKSDSAFSNLRQATRFSPAVASRHLLILETCGWVRRSRRTWSLQIPDHPLARALVKLLSTS
ncbi:MAG TPA: winged helix-turn-helix domain-containing protein [Kiritimatiellia bacterium]|jgi:DNA-binding transcriptional ArsR family regulator|nr:winged helix-turn-helix transcriptional regulator [Lentisphaerota bacterium]HPC20568.1 winged helix-turn-helix domain-containing protein [Kiritimatiellia bacterium]HQN79574.1 winged helix-turn-helix domain-containing protein [Kiritimatiellia bacterium]HQQ61329.1 winged helix-turn-helix domain-containing protein [Kiritimatiellia bacterium]